MSEICSLHTSHSPVNLTIEDHHVIPRAWQRFFAPAPDPSNAELLYPGHYGGETLWDARTVPICPTGHRNVHAIIVATMKRIAREEEEWPLAIYRAARSGKQRDCAQLALERFVAAGGNLFHLTEFGEWGEA
jgi:hypothetical protein